MHGRWLASLKISTWNRSIKNWASGYIPIATARSTWYASIKIRGENISSTLQFLEKTWEEIYTDFPYTYSFMDQDYDNLYADERQLEQVFGAFARFSI